MTTQDLKAYGYRWIVLVLFMIVNAIIQMLWISYATVTKAAENFFKTDQTSIYLLSLSFMIIYIPITFLSSWLLDKYDFKIGTIIGSLFIGIFGFLRIFTNGDYTMALIFQVGVAIGQPFFLNAVTKLSANWFPPSERTTASGISLMAVFLGTALGLFVTPIIVGGIDLFQILNNFPNFQAMMTTYGILSITSVIIYIIFVKNRPPTPPTSEMTSEKVLMVQGLKKLFTNFNFWILFIAFLVGLGVFNTLLTFIEGILLPKGHYSSFAGLFGLLILVGGISGSMTFSLLSDKYKKRKILVITSIIIATTSLLGISLVTDAILLSILGIIFGFGLVSSAPVGLEFAVDLTKPVPEASSNGILMMAGQIGGILFILGLSDFKMPNGDYLPTLLLLVILLAIVFVLLLKIKEK